MNSSQSPDNRAKTRKGRQLSLSSPGNSGPTTFFLKTEKEMERMQRGRKSSRGATVREEEDQITPMPSAEDTSFGVQSLVCNTGEDALPQAYRCFNAVVHECSIELTTTRRKQ